MKYLNFLFVCILGLSCSTPPEKEKETSVRTAAAPGTVIASQSMPIAEDQLNHSDFTVTIKATERSLKGTYRIDAAYGNNTAQSEFTMPRGGEQLKPVMRKGEEPYTFIIGFRQEGDETFYDYYQVSANRGMMEMKYLKAYSFK